MLINKESHQREAFTEWPIRLALSQSVYPTFGMSFLCSAYFLNAKTCQVHIW